MKKVLTKWSPESFKNTQIKNKTNHGFLAVLVSEKLGDDYSTVIVEEGMTEEIALKNLKARFPSSVGIYALVKSHDPSAIEEKTLSGYRVVDDPNDRAEADGVTFYQIAADYLLKYVVADAFDLLGEQVEVSIFDEYGER